MPYTVTYRDAGIKRHEFDTYVRLLAKRGIDWTESQRVPEPGTTNRWLYVWPDRPQAQAFCDEIRRETGDPNWDVRDLPESTSVSPGPLMPIVIYMTWQSLGNTFVLHPHSRTAIRRRFPKARQVSSISVEYLTRSDFEQTHGPIWDHIALVLTGLSSEQLAELGGYRIYDPATEQTVYESCAVAAP